MSIKQKGFTLIELVMVIVILGILAATALPKFVDLTSDAGTAAAQGVAGAVGSATAMNYSKRLISASAAGTYAMNSSNVCAVTGAGTLGAAVNAATGPLVTGVSLAATASGNSIYGITGTGDCSATAAAGTAVNCTVTPTKGTAATASVICSQ
jgi:MSHA pilin protein MshA